MSEDRTPRTASADASPAPPDERLPYEAPRLRSGPAFEKVVLQSGCNFGVFDCTIPC